MRKFLILFLFLFSPLFLFAQENEAIRSLLNKAMEQLDKDINKALYFANDALQKAENEHNTYMTYETYRKIGIIMEDNNRLHEAKDYLGKALSFYGNKDIPKDRQLDILNEWAIINKKLGQYKIAKDYHLKSIEEAKKLGDTEMQEIGYHGLGSMYSMMSDFDNAIKYYVLSMETAEAAGDKESATITQQNIANIYLKAKNLEMATLSVEKALKMAQNLHDSTRIAKILRIYADVELAKGNHAQSLNYNQLAYHIFEQKGDKRNLGETLLSIANMYWEEKKYDQAGDFLYQCKQLLPFLLPYGNANFYNKLGKLYQAKGEEKEAQKAFLSSLQLTDSLGFKELALTNHSALAGIFQGQNNFEKAYYHTNIASKINEELFKEDRQKNFTEAQFKYDIAQSEREIESLKSQKNKIYFTFALFAIALLAYFSFYNYQKNKQLQEKNKAIDVQNKKLEASNNNLLQIAYAAAHDLKEPLRNIVSFVNLIEKKAGIELSRESKEFMTYVVNNTQKLNELYLGLLSFSSIIADDETQGETCDMNTVFANLLYHFEDEIKTRKAQVSCARNMPVLSIKYAHGYEFLQQLLSNALKFSSENPIIHITFEQVSEKEVTISISDNGTGILAIHKDKIFNLFYRGKRENNAGIGVGLAICKAITEKYGGTINFENIESGGSKFTGSFLANK